MLRTLFNIHDGTLIAYALESEAIIFQQLFQIEAHDPKSYTLSKYETDEICLIPAQPWFAPIALDRFMQRRWIGQDTNVKLFDHVSSRDVLASEEFKEFMLTMPVKLRPNRKCRYFEFYMNATDDTISVTIDEMYWSKVEGRKWVTRTEKHSFARGHRSVFKRREFYVFLGSLGINWLQPITRLVVNLHTKDFARVTIDCVGHKKLVPNSTSNGESSDVSGNFGDCG